jgi:hypothetical protein
VCLQSGGGGGKREFLRGAGSAVYKTGNSSWRNFFSDVFTSHRQLALRVFSLNFKTTQLKFPI